MRKAFGILQALMIMLLLSGILTIMLKYARIGAKHTSESYLREQTELFMESSIEHALLDISANDRNTSCWENGFYQYRDGEKLYTSYIKVENYYLYKGEDGKCKGVDINSSESNGFIKIYTETNLSINGKVKIRLIRKNLQRP